MSNQPLLSAASRGVEMDASAASPTTAAAAQPQPKTSKLKRYGALFCVFAYVIAWVSESELLRYIQNKNSDDDSYNKPFFLCWLIICCYSFYLLIWALWYHCVYSPALHNGKLDATAHRRQMNHWKSVVKSGILLCPMYVISGYTWFLSLARTSVTGNTMVFNAQSVFVFLFSVVLLQEKVSPPKLLSVALCFGGVALVVIPAHQEDSSQETVWGYVLVIIAMVTNALYQVLYQRFTHPNWFKPKSTRASPVELPATAASHHSFAAPSTTSSSSSSSELITIDEPLDSNLSLPHTALPASSDSSNTTEHDEHNAMMATAVPSASMMNSFLILGVIGLTNMLLVWPLLPIFDATEVESFATPHGPYRLAVALNVMLDTSMSILLVVGISWSSPLFMSIGGILSLPTSSVADIIIYDYSLPSLSYFGIILIVAGFVILNYGEFLHAKWVAYFRQRQQA